MDNPNNNSDLKEEDEPASIADDYDEGPGVIDIPGPIEAMLKNPPLLPNESKDQFDRVYDDFLDPLLPETVPQHWLVWNSAILTWDVMRYRRMKVAYMLNQRRAAVGGLIRKTFQTSAMRALRTAGSDIDDNVERYFTDPEYPPLVAQALEKSGYTIDVVEAEMFARSLDGLSQIEKLIASAEKRLMLFFREMEKIHGDRAIRAQKTADGALSSEDE
jgi:hypothetical protein